MAMLVSTWDHLGALAGEGGKEERSKFGATMTMMIFTMMIMMMMMTMTRSMKT